MGTEAIPSRAQRLYDKLVARFAPLELHIEDESHHHAGHAGAAGGHSHFRVRIVSEAFRGVSTVARHAIPTTLNARMMTTLNAAMDCRKPK